MTTAALSRPYAERRRRAAELASAWPFAAEVVGLYAAILPVQEAIHEAVIESRPGRLEEVPGWLAERFVRPLLQASIAAGPDALVSAAQTLLYGGDLAEPAAAWLAGAEQSAFDRFFGRAAATPVLEAVPELLPPRAPDAAHLLCPRCGATPQVSWFASSGEALVSGGRRLTCSRCSFSWGYPRMTCAGCGETTTSLLRVFADEERFPHLRVDACDRCRRYLLTVMLERDGHAVPIVDELAALPLDLFAREQGYRKVTPNLMNF
jgi:formate dehydrogenase maturation protein FdhE